MQDEIRRIDEMLMKGKISPEQASTLKQAIVESQLKKEAIINSLAEISSKKDSKLPFRILHMILIIGIILVAAVIILFFIKEVGNMDRALLFAIVSLSVFVLTAWQLFFVSLRNRKIQLEERVNEAWAGVLALYQQKVDLLEKAVSLADRHAQIEKSLFEEVTKMRSRLSDYANVDLEEVDAGISRLMAVIEAYPTTEFGKDYATVILQVKEVENMLAKARLDYNRAVKAYRVFTKAFPGSIVSSGIKEAAYYGA